MADDGTRFLNGGMDRNIAKFFDTIADALSRRDSQFGQEQDHVAST
jgi:hypothetical protein